jgi:hypothetical protein
MNILQCPYCHSLDLTPTHTKSGYSYTPQHNGEDPRLYLLVKTGFVCENCGKPHPLSCTSKVKDHPLPEWDSYLLFSTHVYLKNGPQIIKENFMQELCPV